MPQRLKSLELNGYKTFASKTIFEFSGKITVVVGPNGSGKSNIADSLHWVLGEQSYRLLRGRRTDDMIFSGSETRSRAGMASATVTFDNSDGWLPIDFSEVSITRRAYRDGQNEYRINNQRVRLRDVNELLFKSGLSERTYTVIGQGLVDTALSLKPEERRRLFEEAAGIGLYRDRKEQSLRRLDNTKRNLERVQDILIELEPRIKSLERQARRAREHIQVRDDLQAILREWYGYHWHRAQNNLLKSRNFVNQQNAGLEQERADHEKIDQSLNDVRSKINALRSRLNSWHRQLAHIHLQREETSRELAVSGERRHFLVESQERLQVEINALRQEAGVLQVKLDETINLTSRLQSDSDEAAAQTSAARLALHKLQEERLAKENSLQNTRERISIINTQIIRLTTRQEDIRTRASSHSNNIDEKQKTLDDSIQALSLAEAELANAIEMQHKAEESRLLIIQRLAELRQEFASMESEIKNKYDALIQHQTHLARLHAQQNVLDQAEKELTGYADGAKLLLDAARKGQLSDVRGVLSTHLNVPQEFERAITAALGDFLDAVLIEDMEHTQKALSLLEKEPGKAAILPLAQLAPLPPLSVTDINGCFGLASDLVEASPELRPGIDLLLGQVLVVKDSKVAQRVLSKPDPYTCAVTLNGEVFYRSGTILVNTQSTSSTLSRSRQRRDLITQIEKIERDVEHYTDEIVIIEQHRDSLLEEISSCESDASTAQTRSEEALAVFQSKKLGVEQIKGNVSWHRDQLAAIEQENEQASQSEQELNYQIQQLKQDLSEIEQVQQQLSIQLAELSLNEQQQQIAHWEKATAVSQRALADIQQTLEERQHTFTRAQDQIRTLLEQQSMVEKEIAELQTNVEGMRDSEGGIGSQITELRQLIEPAELELTQGETELMELEAQESLVRQKLNMAERRYSQAQIQLVRDQESMENLRHRIEDDFGLVDFDYDQTFTGPTPLPFEGWVERLELVTAIPDDLEDTLRHKRLQLRRMGSINTEADQEYNEVKERYEFLIEQMADLEKAEADIHSVIAELDELMSREFRITFDQVASEFNDIFKRLFRGGSARLLMTDEHHPTESGVDIEARLPGKRMQRLASLSGGERAMTAVALIFALIKASPTPFCVLDEVDAALDEANIERLTEILTELAEQTQFVIITHNRNTVQMANLIYGITLARDSTSQTISLRLEDVDERYTE